jgi:hypothetical protein
MPDPFSGWPTAAREYASRVNAEWPRNGSAGLFRGEAVVLWRLERPGGNLHCFVVEWPGAFWLGVECARGELRVSQTLPSLEAVVDHAEALRATLFAEGWHEA